MFSFSWVIGYGENAKGGSTDDVRLEKVLQTLDQVFDKSGSVTIDLVNESDVGPESLQVETESGLSVISLGENDGEDYVVRTYTSNSDSREKITILGNEWDLKLVCSDRSIVKEIVAEFLSTGNVSRNLLS